MPDYDFAKFGERGYGGPRFTQIPDELLDDQMALLGHAELKVILHIMRRTYGWRKTSDDISLKQLAEGTGLSRRSVQDAVRTLEEKRLVFVERDLTKAGDSAVNTYRVNSGGWGSNCPTVEKQVAHPSLQETSSQETTESERPAASATARPAVAGVQSDSDVARACRDTAKALGIPREAKQLRTTATDEGWTAEEVVAAGRIVSERHAAGQVDKPGAYLTATVRAVVAQRQTQAEASEMKSADRRRAATDCAMSVYRDKVIGGSWRQAEAVTAESYGRDQAAAVVKELRDGDERGQTLV